MTERAELLWKNINEPDLFLALYFQFSQLRDEKISSVRNEFNISSWSVTIEMLSSTHFGRQETNLLTEYMAYYKWCWDRRKEPQAKFIYFTSWFWSLDVFLTRTNFLILAKLCELSLEPGACDLCFTSYWHFLFFLVPVINHQIRLYP